MKPEAGFHICGRVTAKPEFSTTAKGRKFATFYVEPPRDSFAEDDEDEPF